MTKESRRLDSRFASGFIVGLFVFFPMELQSSVDLEMIHFRNLSFQMVF